MLALFERALDLELPGSDHARLGIRPLCLYFAGVIDLAPGGPAEWWWRHPRDCGSGGRGRRRGRRRVAALGADIAQGLRHGQRSIDHLTPRRLGRSHHLVAAPGRVDRRLGLPGGLQQPDTFCLGIQVRRDEHPHQPGEQHRAITQFISHASIVDPAGGTVLAPTAAPAAIAVDRVRSRRYARTMVVRLHRLAPRLGAEPAELTPVHLRELCEAGIPEGVDLDFKGQDTYTSSGPEGLDELAKDVTALANARGGLIIVGIVEDDQGCANSLNEVAVNDKKIGQMYSGLRARVVPYLPDVWIHGIEAAAGSGTGHVLIAVPASPIAPHAVRMTTRPQYSFARRVGRTTAWLEESEIAALYRDRFRLAREHRDSALEVLEHGSEWVRRVGPASADRIWLEVALAPSGPAERFIDPAHISGLSEFFSRHSKPGAAPHPVFNGLAGRTPEVLRGRVRLDPRVTMSAIALEAYADGRVYLRAPAGLPPLREGSAPVLNFPAMEYWLLILLHAAASYAEWAGAYGDVDVLASLTGPAMVVPSTASLASGFVPFNDPKERTSTEPVHATSTLEALAGDGAQLQACARRIASDLVADLGFVETTLLKPDGTILSARLDPQARLSLEAWMREAGLSLPA